MEKLVGASTLKNILMPKLGSSEVKAALPALPLSTKVPLKSGK